MIILYLSIVSVCFACHTTVVNPMRKPMMVETALPVASDLILQTVKIQQREHKQKKNGIKLQNTPADLLHDLLKAVKLPPVPTLPPKANKNSIVTVMPRPLVVPANKKQETKKGGKGFTRNETKEDEWEGSGEMDVVLTSDVAVTTTRKSVPKQTRRQNTKTTPRPCLSSAKIQVQTIYGWDDSKLGRYNSIIDRNLVQLQKYSGMSLAAFPGRLTRTAIKILLVNGKHVYGQSFAIENFGGSCGNLREFTRKAVSWSNDIPRATFTCRCDRSVDIYKV